MLPQDTYAVNYDSIDVSKLNPESADAYQPLIPPPTPKTKPTPIWHYVPIVVVLCMFPVLGFLIYTSVITVPISESSVITVPRSIDMLQDNDILQQFQLFISKYNKEYHSNEAKSAAYLNFYKNLERVSAHNDKINRSYTIGIHEHSDLNDEELNQFRGCYRGAGSFGSSNGRGFIQTDDMMLSQENVVLPHHLDWRKEGCLLAVQNQEHCGSCWSFSTIGTIEGAYCAQTGHPSPKLSEQELVDCAWTQGNRGCSGGNPTEAFQYAIRHGLTTKDQYSYKGRDQACQIRDTRCEEKDEARVYVQHYRTIPQFNDDLIRKALTLYGPVSVIMHSFVPSFHAYKSGIYTGEHCSPDHIDHALVIVGFGRDEESQQDYFIIRNSWGEDWGDKGYFKILAQRGGKGVCGMYLGTAYVDIGVH